MDIKRAFFFTLGATFLGIGAVGVVTPVLPTTPLVLAAFFCFTQSSEKAEKWISNNRYFGSYIENYKTKAGVPIDVKIYKYHFFMDHHNNIHDLLKAISTFHTANPCWNSRHCTYTVT